MKNRFSKKVTCVLLLLASSCSISSCGEEVPVKYYGVTFDGNGGTLISGELHQKVSSANQIKPPIFEYKGYEFSGWNIPLETINEPVTIEAQWKIESYEITYHLDGGVNSPLNPSHYNIHSGDFYLSGATKNGFNFDHWSLADGRTISMISCSDAKKIELYANYTLKGYSITYELNGGSFLSAPPTTYNMEQELRIPDAQKEGYKFVGWSLEQNGQKAKSNYLIKQGSTGDIKLYAIFTPRTYLVNYYVNGGDAFTDLSDEVIFGTYYCLRTPNRKGYEFVGWTYNGELIDLEGIWSIPTDVAVVAKWATLIYQITYNLNGGSNSYQNPSTYTINDNINFYPANRYGYEFLGWVNNDGQPIDHISAGTTGPLTLTACWNDGNKHVVTLNANGGTVYPSQIDVQYDQAYSLPVPERTGFSFTGWYSGYNSVSSSGTWKNDYDITCTAHWSVNTYSISYELNGGTNNPSNPSKYTVEDSISLEDPERDGYSFKGWFSGDNYVDVIPYGSTGDISLTAIWEANKNKLTLKSEDELKGSVNLASGEGYTDETITIEGIANGDNLFFGWYHDQKCVSRESTYQFVMPSNDYSLVARFVSKEYAESIGMLPVFDLNNNIVTFGLYPSTHVNDENIISRLEQLSYSDLNGWYCLDGIYYHKERAYPRNSNLYQFEDGTYIKYNAFYWFKCEPVRWKILSNSDDDYLVVNDRLYEHYRYDDSKSNYMDSNIREYLNNEFFNTLFTLNSLPIQITEVDNSKETTRNAPDECICPNTYDKLFLLSSQDYSSNYGFTSETRCCLMTDYVRARGLIDLLSNDYYSYGYTDTYYGWYWTRSPSTKSTVDCIARGRFATLNDHPDYSGRIYAPGGIRAAMTIKKMSVS